MSHRQTTQIKKNRCAHFVPVWALLGSVFSSSSPNISSSPSSLTEDRGTADAVEADRPEPTPQMDDPFLSVSPSSANISSVPLPDAPPRARANRSYPSAVIKKGVFVENKYYLKIAPNSK